MERLDMFDITQSKDLCVLVSFINKVIGRKSTNESKEDIRENILEESADVIQNLLLIFNRLGLDPDELLDKVRVKNEKWKSVIPLRKRNEI